MKPGTQKTTAELAKDALALLEAMTPEERRACGKEIGRGFSDEMKRANRRTAVARMKGTA